MKLQMSAAVRLPNTDVPMVSSSTVVSMLGPLVSFRLFLIFRDRWIEGKWKAQDKTCQEINDKEPK
jgi:hypothetical protein